MKIFFYQWNAFMQKGIENAFRRMNIEYDVFFYQFENGDKWEKDDIFVDKFKKKVEQSGYDIVFSVNFVPLISDICEDKGIRYISWVYDSPMHIRSLETVKNKCNEIYIFDRGQVEEYTKQGIDRVYHMPLAVDCDVFNNQIRNISMQDKQKYSSQVSLVGQLYKTEYQYLCSPLDDYTKGYLEGIISAQSKIYGGYFVDSTITYTILDKINQLYRKASNNSFTIAKRELEYTLACEITGRERYLALALLSNRFETKLYSNDIDGRLGKVYFEKYVDYYTQMPKVFNLSDINLNISLKTIRTGIPLRVLDILGCGGFVLTNYQEELLEYFEPGVDMAIYESMEDMVTQAEYYMRNEESRKQIAINGYEKIKATCSFDDRLKKILGKKN